MQEIVSLEKKLQQIFQFDGKEKGEPMSYHDQLPREFVAPVICRIKRKVTMFHKGKYQLCYELEPIVLPERETEKKEPKESESR